MADMLTEIQNSVLKLRKKQARQQQKVNNEIACENPKLLELVFSDFLESVAIYFDDIYAMIIDEILTNEVKVLNTIEQRKQYDRQLEQAKIIQEQEMMEQQNMVKVCIHIFNYIFLLYRLKR